MAHSKKKRQGLFAAEFEKICTPVDVMSLCLIKIQESPKSLHIRIQWAWVALSSIWWGQSKWNATSYENAEDILHVIDLKMPNALHQTRAWKIVEWLHVGWQQMTDIVTFIIIEQKHCSTTPVKNLRKQIY